MKNTAHQNTNKSKGNDPQAKKHSGYPERKVFQGQIKGFSEREENTEGKQRNKKTLFKEIKEL